MHAQGLAQLSKVDVLVPNHGFNLLVTELALVQVGLQSRNVDVNDFLVVSDLGRRRCLELSHQLLKIFDFALHSGLLICERFRLSFEHCKHSLNLLNELLVLSDDLLNFLNLGFCLGHRRVILIR